MFFRPPSTTRRRGRARSGWRSLIVAGAGAVLAACAAARSAPPPGATQKTHGAPDLLRGGSIPARLGDDAFWRMVTEFSEPGGFFRSDNFVSNETTFQYVLPTLTKNGAPGGAYLGVGPDQNFTYLVALRPRIAFIVDIRRQNMLQHLLYKALIELSPDRADFLSRLFSRPRPPGLDSTATVAALLDAFAATPGDSLLFRKNLAAVREQLVSRHGFALDDDDLRTIAYIYGAFFAAGPEITYSFSPERPTMFFGRRMPTYAELMVETDGQGAQRSYVATEANYRMLRELETNNLVVPVVGDFGGDKAIRAVARYLTEHGATVTAFYTSNVEQYLFQQDSAWRKFFANVGRLPLDSSSTFIRAVFNFGGYRDPSVTPGPRSATLLAPIAQMVRAANDGRIQSYYDVVQMSK